MATRSTITVRTGANERKSIYCHYDGYPSHNGAILKEHYNTLERVKDLVNLGDLSILAPQLEQDKEPNNWKVSKFEKRDGKFGSFEVPTDKPHSFDNQHLGVCVAYGRDRGEEGTKAQILRNVDAVDEQEYNYFFDDGKWFVNGRELTDEIIQMY